MAGLLDFAARFGTEERCIEHLAGLRWPGGFVCSGCSGRVAWRLKARPRVYECGTCHRQESVTAGTVFHRTRTDLTKWFLAAYLMGRDKRGVSAKFLQRELDRSVAFDRRQRHLRLDRRVVLLPCPLHVLLLRHRRLLGAGFHLSQLSHFRGPPQGSSKTP